jgi:L-ribulokinase
MKQYTIGVDFGTLSGRAVLLNAQTGEVLASSVLEYRHAVMDRELPNGTPLPPLFALQHPSDYLEVLQTVIPGVLEQTGVAPDEIAGLGIDFTSCTMLPIDEDGTPLCLNEKYASEPHAYVKLWKHHGAQAQADRMTAVARERGEVWLSRYGGKFSSEWGLPKIYETLEHAPSVYADTARFCEAGDWLSLLLTGKETHAAAFAGFKFCWDADGGFPSNDYLCAVDPRLDGLVGTKLSAKVNTVEEMAGRLSARGAELTGLPVGTPLSLPMLDAEAAMPALGITSSGVLMLIIGTSGVQIVHTDRKLDISGICGYVKNAVVPGLYTYEAGQSGVGDSFDWFVKNCVPESYMQAVRERGISIHQYLREKASALRIGESGLIALDWLGGNRSTLQDAELSGLLLGLHIGTRPEEIYRALIESTAYGMRKIVSTYTGGGIAIREVRASGGIAKKDAMLMQIYADVLGCEISVIDTDQAGALGSAIYASVAAGLYPSVSEASDALSVKTAKVYRPIPENQAAYEKLYREYETLYEYFGTVNAVMKRLKK